MENCWELRRIMTVRITCLHLQTKTSVLRFLRVRSLLREVVNSRWVPLVLQATGLTCFDLLSRIKDGHALKSSWQAHHLRTGLTNLPPRLLSHQDLYPWTRLGNLGGTGTAVKWRKCKVRGFSVCPPIISFQKLCPRHRCPALQTPLPRSVPSKFPRSLCRFPDQQSASMGRMHCGLSMHEERGALFSVWFYCLTHVHVAVWPG